MSTISLFNKALLSSSVLLLLTACNNEEKVTKENKTVLDQQINAVNMAKESVKATNTKTEQTNNTAPAVQPQPQPQPQALNVSTLYLTKCASCHGNNAEKSALNASANISQWDAKKIENALLGYKNGTYGGKMKGIMQAQSKPLSNEEIRHLSDYITLL